MVVSLIDKPAKTYGGEMLRAGLVFTGAAVIHSGNAANGLCDLANVSVMHQPGSGVRFSGAFTSVVPG